MSKLLKRLGIESSIFRRLLISYFVLVFISLLLTGTVTSYMVENRLEADLKQEALRTADWVNRSLQAGNIFSDTERQDIIEFLGTLFDVTIWLVDQNGDITNASAGQESAIGRQLNENLMNRLLEGETVYPRNLVQGSPPPLSVAVPMISGETIQGAIIIHTSSGPLLTASSQLREVILWITILALVVATGLGSYLAWTISNPIKSVTRVATDLAHGDFKKRVEVRTRDETKDLARAINDMAERLQSLEQEKATFRTARQNFMAGASHELRSPLTTIQGYAEALQDGLVEDPETRLDYLDKIHQQCSVLERLVSDLLELNRIESGQVEIAPRPVQIWNIAKDVVNQVQSEAKKKGTSIDLDFPETLPPILADEVRLRQILINLFRNAVKFTEDGTIRLHAHTDETQEELVLEITDTGTGIPQGDLSHIWRRFYRGANSRKSEGAGLGLTIVRELVTLQNGWINVESTEGEGSTFRFGLPIA